MAYFSNGTEGDLYEERWCNRCIHRDGPNGDTGCAVWMAHLLYSYRDCNDEDSILHILIPRSKDGLGNEQCTMFSERKPEVRRQLVDVIADDLRDRQISRAERRP